MASKYENKELLTATKIYFDECSHRSSLLTDEEERTLLTRFVTGRTFNNDNKENVGINDLLKSMELTEDSRQAYEELITRNQRLVVHIARRNPRGGLELMDRIQNGNEGLMIALAKFQLEKGVKFSTYAYYWIEQRIKRNNSDTGHIIRLPVHVCNRLWQAEKKRVVMEQQLGRKLSDNEFIQLMNTSPARAEAICNARRSPDSLDRPIDEGDNNSKEIGDCVVDETGNVEKVVEQKIVQEQVDLLMRNNLTERERFVVRCYYGFETGKPMTLEAIGKKLKVTRERVRQIRRVAEQKISEKISKDEWR